MSPTDKNILGEIVALPEKSMFGNATLIRQLTAPSNTSFAGSENENRVP